MAAITIASLTGAHNGTVTLSGTPNTMQEIEIPSNARMIEIFFEVNSGKLVHNSGTDSAVISSEAAWPVPKESSYYWAIPRSRAAHSIWVASATGSTVCHYAIYEA